MQRERGVARCERELELRVRLVAGDAALHRLLATLHRKRAVVASMTYQATTGVAVVGVSAAADAVDHLVAAIAREVTVREVVVLPSEEAAP